MQRGWCAEQEPGGQGVCRAHEQAVIVLPLVGRSVEGVAGCTDHARRLGIQVKSTEVANATRWTGIFRCASKTRLLEPDIKIGLTGEADAIGAGVPCYV